MIRKAPPTRRPLMSPIALPNSLKGRKPTSWFLRVNTVALLVFCLTSVAGVAASILAFHVGRHIGFNSGARLEAVRYNDELLRREAAIAIWDASELKMQLHFPEGMKAEAVQRFAAHFRYQELGEADYMANKPTDLEEIRERWRKTSALSEVQVSMGDLGDVKGLLAAPSDDPH